MRMKKTGENTLRLFEAILVLVLTAIPAYLVPTLVEWSFNPSDWDSISIYVAISLYIGIIRKMFRTNLFD